MPLSFLCPSCSSSKYTDTMPYRGKAPGFRNAQIVTCRTCGLVSMSPLPTGGQLASYYSTFWCRVDEHDAMPAMIAQARSRYDFIQTALPKIRPLRVLDYGA